MAKSVLEKELEKQRRLAVKTAREERIRQIALSIINSQPVVHGVQIMDSDSEAFLDAILA